MISIETQARRYEQMYSGDHRKLFGTHYTPDSLVDYIVRRVLRPVLDFPNSLSSIRILDPSCGTGLFLLRAYDILADQWRKIFGSFTSKDAKHILENSLFGIDIDESAVLATRKHLLQKASLTESDFVNIDQNIIAGDALAFCHSPTLISVNDNSSNAPSPGKLFSKHSFDCIIGNPPYIRIQNTPIEKRECYALSYTTAAGRFDISALFFELAEYLLNENGRVGFIVSNKVLSTSGARRLRYFLLTHFNIEEIVDLADTKFFEAAVLPMIFIAGRPGENKNRIAYSLITESHGGTGSTVSTDNLIQYLDNADIPFEANVSVADKTFQVQRFYTPAPSMRAKVWSFHNDRQNRLLSKLRSNSACTLADISEKISVGMKTTADNVFIKPMTRDFILEKGLERELIFPLLESHNIKRWTYSWDSQQDLFVLYPYFERNGKVIPVELDAYPQIKKYLESNRSQLEARTYLIKSERRWYEIWVHQSPSDFSKRKIVTPDISSHNRFALDDKGFYINGTCFYLILKDDSDAAYYSILGLLNSKIIEYFHKVTVGNSLYAKRFRYWSSYIGEYPIAKRWFDSQDLRSAIIDTVSRLLSTTNENERAELEKENDRLCYRLFDLTDNEIEEVISTLSICSPPSPRKGISVK